LTDQGVQHLNLFPISLYKFSLNEDLNKLKNDIYSLQEKSSGRKISNVGGWQSDDLTNDKNFTFISDIINTFCQQIMNTKLIEVKEIWANINPINTYNDIHNHIGPGYTSNSREWSGIYYIQYKKGNGEIQFRDYNDLNNVAMYTPLEQDVLIFPANIIHGVKINKLNSDRISIAFNFITEEVPKVHVI
tara:strand:- start:58 stop:624 length:567 start_codon:yes stop_codon:yes gene_type:complete